MPLVQVRFGPRMDAQITGVARSLPAVIAKHLDVPGTSGALEAEDIEVWVQAHGPYDQPRISEDHSSDLQIVVSANEYPNRAANLEERNQQIGEEIKALLPPALQDIRMFVWINLIPTASFMEF